MSRTNKPELSGDYEAEAAALAEVLEVNLKDLVTKNYLDARLKDTEARLNGRIKDEISKLDVRTVRLEADMVWTKRLAWAILGAAVLQLLKSFGMP